MPAGGETTCMRNISGKDRKYLRGLAHALKPLVYVGRAGVSGPVVESLDAALDDHELVKVKFLDFKEQRRELSDEIAVMLEAELAGLIGNVAIFYRPQKDPQRRRIAIPD